MLGISPETLANRWLTEKVMIVDYLTVLKVFRVQDITTGGHRGS
jgi:hypothetical protein